jgi:hypothetical protein
VKNGTDRDRRVTSRMAVSGPGLRLDPWPALHLLGLAGDAIRARGCAALCAPVSVCVV